MLMGRNPSAALIAVKNAFSVPFFASLTLIDGVTRRWWHEMDTQNYRDQFFFSFLSRSQWMGKLCFGIYGKHLFEIYVVCIVCTMKNTLFYMVCERIGLNGYYHTRLIVNFVIIKQNGLVSPASKKILADIRNAMTITCAEWYHQPSKQKRGRNMGRGVIITPSLTAMPIHQFPTPPAVMSYLFSFKL